LKLLNSETVPGGTKFTLGWTEPDRVRNVAGFNILYNGREARGSQFVAKSPAEVTVPVVGGGEPFTFTVQTVLSSGLSSIIDNCPATSGTTRSGKTSGVTTLVAGAATVVTTAVRASSIILLTGQNVSGTVGELSVLSRSDSQFAISSSNAADTRTVGWVVIEP
jgi:hypothetical protein